MPRLKDPPFCAARPRCPVCKSPHRAQLHALRAARMPLEELEGVTRKLGSPIKRETISAHFRVCMAGKDLLADIDAKMISDGIANPQTEAERDFAHLVQQKASALLLSGDLRISASHGLAAQALLDRRAEKAADRDLTLNIARLLSGAMIMPPSGVIESRRVINVTPDLLAPDDLIEGR